MFLSRNAVFGGTLAVTGASTFTAAATFNAGAVIAASQALTGTAANSTISGFLSVSATNFISGTTTTTAFAGATTLLTIGGTGASSVFAIPGTLDASGTTGALTVAGGAYVAKALNVAGTITGSGFNGVTFANLANNGTFDANTTGWTAGDATLASVVGGIDGNNCLEITRTGASAQSASQQLSGLTVGRVYRLTVSVKSGSSGAESFVVDVLNAAQTANLALFYGTSTSNWNTYSVTWVATETNPWIFLYKNTATAGTMLFDSASVSI